MTFTFAETAHKIANMVAMLTHHDRRLKMPRPAAYRRAQAHTNSLAAHPASLQKHNKSDPRTIYRTKAFHRTDISFFFHCHIPAGVK